MMKNFNQNDDQIDEKISTRRMIKLMKNLNKNE